MQVRLGVSSFAVETFFGNCIEERVEAIKLSLSNGVVFVIVAARAAKRHPHPCGGGRLHTIHDVLVLILFRDGAAFEIDHVVAIETGRDLLRVGCIGQQIAGKLLHGEAVIRHVFVECANDPISPMPHLASAVDVVAVRVGVSCQIQPLHGHAFAVSR